MVMRASDFGAHTSFAALLTLGACMTPVKPLADDRPRPTVEVVQEPEWKAIASAADEDRLLRISDAWREGLAQARAAGFRKAVEEEGELLKPEAGLPRPDPTPGSYRCRVIKLGKQGKSSGVFDSYKPFFCYVEVEGQLLTIVKQTGSQRPAGRLYADSDPNRLIFLGTVALGSEESPLPYGEKAERDVAGVMERIAPFRFRLVTPWPKKESKIDVMELVPVIPTP